MIEQILPYLGLCCEFVSTVNKRQQEERCGKKLLLGKRHFVRHMGTYEGYWDKQKLLLLAL